MSCTDDVDLGQNGRFDLGLDREREPVTGFLVDTTPYAGGVVFTPTLRVLTSMMGGRVFGMYKGGVGEREYSVVLPRASDVTLRGIVARTEDGEYYRGAVLFLGKDTDCTRFVGLDGFDTMYLESHTFIDRWDEDLGGRPTGYNSYTVERFWTEGVQ